MAIAVLNELREGFINEKRGEILVVPKPSNLLISSYYHILINPIGCFSEKIVEL